MNVVLNLLLCQCSINKLTFNIVSIVSLSLYDVKFKALDSQLCVKMEMIFVYFVVRLTHLLSFQFMKLPTESPTLETLHQKKQLNY